MAIGGRKPTPASIKRLRGNPGKRPIADEPDVAKAEPTIPETLSESAKEVWRALAPELVRAGVLSAVDGGLFACYCTAIADFDKANDVLTREGYLVESPNGYQVQHPMLAIRKNAAREIARIAPEFGLSASSRTRVHVQPPPREPNRFARFFGSPDDDASPLRKKKA